MLPGRLEQQVAGPDEALEQRLGEGDVVDALQGDLAAEQQPPPRRRKISRSVVSTKWCGPAQDPPGRRGQQHHEGENADDGRAGCCRSPAGMTTQAAPTPTTTATVSSTGTTRVSQCGRRS